MDLTPGTVLERYTVEGELGRGGMAVVYRVTHNQLGSQHAMKVLTIQSRPIRKRLMQEGRVQSTLRHPNIVSVTDIVDVDGTPALVMEYVRGPTLADFLINCRPSEPQADALAAGILAGVTAAHTLGLVHRDLKPGNILLSLAGGTPVPKVTDFGLVKMLDQPGDSATRTQSGSSMGTPAYMAPEQIRDASSVDHRADLWSLGTILYEMVSGRRTFTGNDRMEIFQAVCAGRFQGLDNSVPKRFRTAIEAALRVDPDERVQDCTALRALWTGEQEDPWAQARGIWDQKTLFQVASISADEKPSEVPVALPSEVGTFLMTTASERRTLEIHDMSVPTATTPTGLTTLVHAIGPPLWEAVMGGPIPDVSWEEAVGFAVAFAEHTGTPPAYVLGPWTLRKAYSLDAIGRILYDHLKHDRIGLVLARFGDDTLEILQFHPERLAEIEGIGPKTAEKIGLSWDRTLCFTRSIERTGQGWRLPTDAELAEIAVDQWEWTDDADGGPLWSDVPSEVPDPEGGRRLVRKGDECRALRPESRDGLRFRLVLTA